MEEMFTFSKAELTNFVDRLITGEFADNALAKRLAKLEPLLFLEITEDIVDAMLHTNIVDAMLNTQNNNRVPAIKAIRTQFGVGLKEGLAIQKALADYMSDYGLAISPEDRDWTLDSTSMRIVDDLKVAVNKYYRL